MGGPGCLRRPAAGEAIGVIEVRGLNHATLIVDDLAKARGFYSGVLGLEEVPAYDFDYPVMFYRLADGRQIHISEWPDARSFRGHIAIEVADFSAAFREFKASGIIDPAPWGRVRRLKDGTMQMFVRDPAGNLVEISQRTGRPIDPEVTADALFDPEPVYRSGRNDGRGVRGTDATLYRG